MINVDEKAKMILSDCQVHNDILNIPLYYPRNEEIKKIEVELMDVRAADSILVEYDFLRDGWLISQASKFQWDEGDEECDPDWQEVAFIESWGRRESV